MAIVQQQLDMKSLRSRINGLSVSSDGIDPRSNHLTGSQTKRPLNVTPNVAATTAAALNAERSAQKLKRVLLATRSSPLLNNKAAQVSVPTSFQTPQKPGTVKPDPETPAGIFSLPATPVMNFPPSFTNWSPASPTDFGDSPSSNASLARHRGGNKHHQKPIPLKKSSMPAVATPATPPSFDWGPIQPIKPMTTLAFDLRQKADK